MCRARDPFLLMTLRTWSSAVRFDFWRRRSSGVSAAAGEDEGNEDDPPRRVLNIEFKVLSFCVEFKVLSFWGGSLH